MIKRTALRIVFAVALCMACALTTTSFATAQRLPSISRIVQFADNAAELRNLYGEMRSSADLDDMRAALAKAREYGVTGLMPTTKTVAQHLNEMLLRKDLDVVTLTGHTDKNGFLRLIDGSWIDLQTLHRQPGGPYIVVVSCRSMEFAGVPPRFVGLSQTVKPIVGVEIEQHVRAIINTMNAATLNEGTLQVALNRADNLVYIDRLLAKERVAGVAIVTAGSGVLVVYPRTRTN